MKIDLKVLQAAGVDFKLNKQDIIDLFVEDVRERCEARLEEIKVRLTKVEEEQLKTEKLHAYAQLATCAKDRNVKTLRRAMEKLHGEEFVLQLQEDYYRTRHVVLGILSEKHTYLFGDIPVKTFSHDLCSEDGKSAYIGLLSKAPPHPDLEALMAEQRELKSTLHNLALDSRKIRLEIVKAMLAGSDEGEKLLTMLDSRRARNQLTSGK